MKKNFLCFESFTKKSFVVVATIISVSGGFFVPNFAEAAGVLGVTQISAVQTYAQSDNTFENGWKWVFDVTVPDTEPVLMMRFADWIGIADSIAAANNIRFYSGQSSNAADAEHAVLITGAGIYSDVMNLVPGVDLDTSKAGRQIQIVVEARVPSGSAGGSYSTSYGIKSDLDTVAPVITLNGSNPVNTEVGFSYTDAGATALDNIDGSLVPSMSGLVNTATVGVYTLTYNVSDSVGNAAVSITRTVNVIDTTDPVVTAPEDQSFEATGPITTPILTQATATDNSDTPIVITYNPYDFPIGTTEVTWTATDVSGNNSTATSHVTVTDTTAPIIINMPTDITGEATSGSGAVATYTDPSATDLVDGAVVVACVPSSGSTFPLGTSVVTCTATDFHGNAADSTFSVIIQDTTSPIISDTSNDIVVETGPTGDAVVTYTNPSATDLVDGSVVTVCVPASGSVFPYGQTLVTCTAIDAHSNSSNSTFNVTVQDTTIPVITIDDYTTDPTNQDIVVTAHTNEGTLNGFGSATFAHPFTENGSFDFVATDIAGHVATSTVTIDNIDKVLPIITIDPFLTDPTNQDITVTVHTNEGTLNVDSHIFTENGSFDFVATDVAGNVATLTVTITNIDKTVPTLGVTGFTADGNDMLGNLVDGFTLNTDNGPSSHMLQFKVGSAADENLRDEVFGLFLIPTGSQTSDLQSYYSTKPEPYRAYLNDAAAGTAPFAYIKGSGDTSLRLLDGAMHYFGAGDVDMIVPDNYPLGTYTVRGVIKDLAGNETTVTYKLIVAGSATAPTATVTYDPDTLTNGDVVATIHPSETLVDGSELTHLFTDNGSYTFHFTSLRRASGSVTATVSYIDKIAPTIETYTIDNPVISPNGDGNKDTTDIDLAFSEKVDYDISVKSGLIVIKHWAGTAKNPDPRIWNGKDASDTVVPDGLYDVVVEFTDMAGNSVIDTSKTIRVDTVAPVITLQGEGNNGNPAYVIASSTYADAGATATDDVEGAVSVQVSGLAEVNTNVVGSYIVTYTAADSVGNTATKTRTVEVIEPQYDITIMSNTGGTISAIAQSLTDATYKITPDSGYRIVDVVVDGIPQGAITTYTFTNIHGNHTISATFELIPPSLSSADVTSDTIRIGDLASANLIKSDISGVMHVIDVANVVTVNGNLPSQEYPFSLISSTVALNDLKAYFDGKSGWTPEMKTQINSEIDGISPFLYFVSDGTGGYSLVDGFQKSFGLGNQSLRIDDDYPAGTYIYQGIVGGNTINVTLTISSE